MIDCYEYKGNMGAQVPFEELRGIQLRLLDVITNFCDENGLRYYLSGGTLLGAVRHKGYIPWDDDIDINMPRPDCDRLLKITGGKLPGGIEIGAFGGPVDHPVPFIRAYDTNYLMRLESEKKQIRAYTNVSIDIFPVDGLPKSEAMSRVHYFLAKSLVILRRVAYYRELTGDWDWHRVIRFLAFLPAKAVGWKNWNRLIQKLSRACDYEKSEYVGVVCCCVHTNTERMLREDYGEPAAVAFEGRTLRAPRDWDGYLKRIYGDYMALPPADKQKRHHHCTVYSLKEAVK